MIFLLANDGKSVPGNGRFRSEKGEKSGKIYVCLTFLAKTNPESENVTKKALFCRFVPDILQTDEDIFIMKSIVNPLLFVYFRRRYQYEI